MRFRYRAAIWIGFLVLGFIQGDAIDDGLTEWLGMGFFTSLIVGHFLGYVPVVGSIIGVVGAVDIWGWHWYWAVLLFFGWAAVLVVLYVQGRKPTGVFGGRDWFGNR